MNLKSVFIQTSCAGLIFGCGLTDAVSAQVETRQQPTVRIAPRPVAPPTTDPIFSQQIPEPPAQMPIVGRESRAQAYAKLLEGQRYLWTVGRLRSATGIAASGKAAREALLKAVALDPGLAEAYTALAELNFDLRLDQAQTERAAKIAVRLDPNNFGARRLLARLYTVQSRLTAAEFDRAAGEKAVAEWREVARLDARNAEAWAFLSELYERLGQTSGTIEALRNWNGAVEPFDSRFYKALTNGQSLAPEAAAVRLGEALAGAGRTGEAIEVLSRVVGEEPNDKSALEALRQALENGDGAQASQASESLRRAVRAAPENAVLVELLAAAEARAGKIESAVALLQTTGDKLAEGDKPAAANLFFVLGQINENAGRSLPALGAYEKALTTMEIGREPLALDEQRAFAAKVLPRVAAVHRQAGRGSEARAAIARLRTLLGDSDSTADQTLIETLRKAGEPQAALEAARDAGKRFPRETVFPDLEAAILKDLGRVDEAVGLLRSKIVNKSKQIAVPQAVVPDFIAHIKIADFYLRAGRGDDAVGAARQALDLAQTDEMTNIGLITLATAQNAANDFKSAETSLREVLKRDQNNATALNNLGYFLVERGERVPEAVDLIRRAVQIDPANASFLDSLGWAHFKQGQLAEAEKHLTEAARRNPNSATTHDHLGDLYQQQGKTEAARQAWRKALSLSNEATEIEKIRVKLGEPKKTRK